ncbi:hypothetical protein ACWEPL_33715 [Nonomuraea sp. NPDC004186]|uniref:hypothetical protein n=1 Tax=Nonomuraea sp. NPDC049625 TaxID=3155775 RepID=UPI003437E7AF
MSEQPVIVLVHGAFAESAGWNRVIPRLHDHRLTAVAAANPLRSVEGDAAYVRDVINGIGRPVGRATEPPDPAAPGPAVAPMRPIRHGTRLLKGPRGPWVLPWLWGFAWSVQRKLMHLAHAAAGGRYGDAGLRR